MERQIELAGFGLGVTGWFCTMLTRFLPVWSVTGTLENTTATLPMYWDGVWLSWEQHSSGNLHCSSYKALFSLVGAFRSWKVLLTSAICVGVFPLVIYLVGLVKFPKRVQVKAAAGIVFIVSGLLLLVVMAWTTHTTTQELSDELHLTRDWGAALYCGWIGATLQMVGGGVLSTKCCTATEQEDQREVRTPMQDHPLHTIQSTAYAQDPCPYPRTSTPY